MEELLIVGFDENNKLVLAGGQFRAGDVKEYFEKIKNGEL